jgi:opacity protein-like surface antigen
MNLKSLVLAAALLPAAIGSAYANDYTSPVIALSGGPTQWSTFFGATHTAGAFTDTYTFSYSGDDAVARGHFLNTGFLGMFDIDFTSATLNGTTLPTFNLGTPLLSASGSLFNDVSVDGQLTLVIKGTTKSDIASYAGTLNLVSAVPEPTTYGMLLGGMGVLAFMARRRKQK